MTLDKALDALEDFSVLTVQDAFESFKAAASFKFFFQSSGLLLT